MAKSSFDNDEDDIPRADSNAAAEKVSNLIKKSKEEGEILTAQPNSQSVARTEISRNRPSNRSRQPDRPATPVRRKSITDKGARFEK